MKLSVYLMRESVKNFDDVLQDKYLDGDAAFEPLDCKIKLPFPCQAYIQKNKAKKPKWMAFLRSHFKLSGLDLLNQTNSFVLLVEVAGRIFAITFGYGFQALNRAKVEPRFGLIVAANSIQDKELCTVESNEVDTFTRHKQLHISKGSSISEFELNPHMDWIRKLSGTLHSSDLATSVTGSDSVCISVDCDLPGVEGKCEKLLKLFKSTKYKQRFDIIDHLQPIGKHEPKVRRLEKLLAKRLENRSNDRISLAFPEIPDPELLDHYKISGNHSSLNLEELSLEGIYRVMDEKVMAPDAGEIHILGIGDNNEPCTKRRSLREYLVCEFDDGEETYIFCHGDWFRAEKDYVEKIRQEVADLTDVTDELELPPIKNGEDEGDYNERTSGQNGLLLFDKDNFRIGGSYDKIEVCDLMNESADFICVKKMTESSSLSHLFSQGSVSASLLRGEPEYLAHLNEVAAEEWPNFKKIKGDSLGRVRIVYGIATRKAEPLSQGMFFFSLVNLLNHARKIQMLGCKVALCKIEYETSPAEPTVTKRKRRSRKVPGAANGHASFTSRRT